MNAIQTRSPRMGWLGVQTARDELLCWACAVRKGHHGAMLEPEDVLADDRCDECGTVLLTSDPPPASDVTRQLAEAGVIDLIKRDEDGRVMTHESQANELGFEGQYLTLDECHMDQAVVRTSMPPLGPRWHERFRRWRFSLKK